MSCLGALAGVLGGWSVGIPIYLGTMSITGPLNCLLAGPVTGCLTPLYSSLALAMGCVGGELSGILSCLMGPCGPLAPAVAGSLGGIVGCVSSTLGCSVTCPLDCLTSFCGPWFLCSPCIGLGYALINIPITTMGGMLTGLMGSSGPLLGLGGCTTMAGVLGASITGVVATIPCVGASIAASGMAIGSGAACGGCATNVIPAGTVAVIGGVTGLGVVGSVWAALLLLAGAIATIPCVGASIAASGMAIGSGAACGGCAIGIIPVLADLVPNLTDLVSTVV